MRAPPPQVAQQCTAYNPKQPPPAHAFYSSATPLPGAPQRRQPMTAGSAVLPRARRRASWFTADRVTALLMLLPSVVAIAVFVYYFIGRTAYVSFTDWNQIRDPQNLNLKLVGWENYEKVFAQARFQTDFRNLIVFTTFFLSGCLALGLLLALLVDSHVHGEAFFRSVYLFPMALSFIVTGVSWRWLFTPGNMPLDPTGINLLLHRAGLDFLQSAWITNAAVWPGTKTALLKTKLGIPLAIVPVVLAAIWQMAGFTMAMYLAGLRSIGEELREAAIVDGATEWDVFRLIKLPLLRPVTLSAVIVLAHASLKIFDLVLTMTGGGPGNATEVPGILMYELTFKSNKIAQGSAVAVVMLLLIAVLIIPYLWNTMRTELEQ